MSRIIAAQIEGDEIMAIKTLDDPCLSWAEANFQVVMGREFWAQVDNQHYKFEVNLDKELIEIPLEIMKKLPSF